MNLVGKVGEYSVQKTNQKGFLKVAILFQQTSWRKEMAA